MMIETMGSGSIREPRRKKSQELLEIPNSRDRGKGLRSNELTHNGEKAPKLHPPNTPSIGNVTRHTKPQNTANRVKIKSPSPPL